KIFASQRDHHTWYESPTPGGCYTAFLPFSVVPALDNNNTEVAVVRSIRSQGNTFELAPELKKLNPGDVLVAINDLSPKAEISRLNPYNSGSNDGAFTRTGHSILTYRRQSSFPLPKENSVKLKFKKLNGDLFETTLAWLVFQDDECLKPKKNGEGSKKDTDAAENTFVTEYEKFYQVKKPSLKKSNSIFRSFQVTDPKNEDKSFTIVNPSTETAETSITWWSFKNENGLFGVIKLASFSPEVSVSEAKSIISKLMTNELANVDGIIFDLRNNGGGTISYGHTITELVTAKPLDVLKFQLLNTPATRHYFFTAEPDSPFALELKKAEETKNIMTAAIPLSKASDVYNDGQSFFKPVAIFTNSSCYSTCDMMSALFQDHNLGDIWAEDAQTGAGGANNWNYDYIIGNLPKDNLGPFQKLPFGMNIGFAFRQTVRTGSHAGELIEDEGVKADHVIPTTVEDVITNGKSQFVKISAGLAAKKADYQSWADFNKEAKFETTSDVLDLLVDFKGTEKVQVYYKKQLITEVATINSLSTQTVKLNIPMNAIAKNFGDIEIKGFKNSQPVWRKVTSIRKTSESIKLAKDQELSVNLQSGTAPLVLYNKHEDETLGWHAESGALRLGNATGYDISVDSTASLFVDLANKTNAILAFNLEFYTELNFDFVSVFIIAGDKTMVVLKPTSGEFAARDFIVNLTPFAGQKIEVRFRFTSDEALNDKGAWIKNIKIK
ncbi:MAG: hypothetical protein K2Q18_17655, partial [Bdellovibrionales bacterium]|nr:hypothetical protein [Bdellovibrionales bacterium]